MIYGDASQTRSSCYVSALIEGGLRLKGTPDDHTGPVNLGNPKEFTMLKLAELDLELSGSDSRLEHHALPQDDPTQRRPDITLVKLGASGLIARRPHSDNHAFQGVTAR